jgi:hypothetical protein
MEPGPRRIPLNAATFDDIMASFVPHLLPGEKILYTTKGKVTVGDLKDIPAHVTNQRVLFYEKKEKEGAGILTRASDVSFKTLKVYRLAEEGFLSKRLYLLLNDRKIYGERTDLTGLYEAIRSAKPE